MASRFQTQLDRVAARLNSFNGETVTVSRAGVGSFQATASPIKRIAEEYVPGMASTRFEYQDWGIDVAEYDFGAGPVVPELGDTITREDGNIFSLISLGDTEPVYDYTTSTRNRFLVHSQQTGLA